jgi:hypothetical protein
VRENRFGLIVRSMRHDDSSGPPPGDEALEKCVPQTPCSIFEIPFVPGGCRRDVFAFQKALKPPRARLFRDELRVSVGFGATKAMVKMNDQQRDTKLVAQVCEQSQKRHRVGAARHGHASPVAGYEHMRMANVREQTSFEWCHGSKFRAGMAGLYP